MSPWFKCHSSYFTEKRSIVLRRALPKDVALWLPLKVWCVASVEGTGDFSAYQPEELAELLGYTGNAVKMLKALQAAGYLTEDNQVVGWDDLFALAKSYSESAKARAAKRWGKSAPSDLREEKIREEERRGEYEALPQALPQASEAPAPILFPFSQFTELPADTQARIMSRGSEGGWGADPTIESLQAKFDELRGRKLKFRDTYTPDQWLVVIESELTDEAGKKSGNSRSFKPSFERFNSGDRPASPLGPQAGPDGWHSLLADACPDNVYTTQGSDNYLSPEQWHLLPAHAQNIVMKLVKGAA